MACDMFKISSQYLKNNRITVTILNVINPAHYVIKETPDLNASSEAKNFLEAEESMQKYYNSFDQGFFQLPLKDAIIVILHEKKFYRAKVIKILNLSAGHLFKVYLVDYGVECSVTRDCIYEIEKDFLSHPFQAVNMKLLGIEPISLVMNPADLSMSYGPVTYWDPSAEIYINDMQKTMCNAYIEIKAVDEQCIYGSIFMCFEDNSVKCINDELICNTFATFDENCWKKVYRIEDVLENNFSKYDKSESAPEPKKPDPDHNASSDLSPAENLGDFIDLRSSFISPSDGKIVATSSISMKAAEPSNSNPENFVDKVLEEKDEALSSDVLVEKSPDPKVIALSRFQKLQMLNKKRHSSPSNVLTSNSPSASVDKTPIEENLSSDVSLDETKSSDHLDAIKSCVPPSVYTNNNLDDHNYQSDMQKSPVSCEKETKERNDALSKTPTSNKFKKLQELHRKRQSSSFTSVEHNLPPAAPSNKTENSIVDLNVNVVEDNEKVNDTSCVALTSPKQECISEVETRIPNKLKKLQELRRKHLSNSAPSADSITNSVKNLNLCDTSSEKDISKVSGTNKDSLNEVNNEQKDLSDSEKLNPTSVQPSISKDMSCSLEPATISKFKKLQELRKRHQSNIVPSDDQLTDVRVSSDLQEDLVSVINDKKDCDNKNLKSSVAQPLVSKEMTRSSPESAATSKLKKLQELNKKRRSNIVSSGDQLTDIRVSSNLEKDLMSVPKKEDCDSENLKSSSVQPSVSKDMSYSKESAATSKLKKLQELNKKRRSNMSSGDQLTDVRVSSDLEKDLMSTPKDKKEDCLVSSNVIVDSDNFSECNIDNVSNVCSDSVSFKATCDSPQVSEVICNASSPSSSENSLKQNNNTMAQAFSSRFQKLQELNRKRQSSTVQRNAHLVDDKDKFSMEKNTSTTSEKIRTQSSDSSLSRNNESINNINLPTVLIDSGIETCIQQHSTDVNANSIFGDNDNTKDTVTIKANDNACFNPLTPANSKDAYHAAASEDKAKQENKQMIISEKARTLQRLQQQVRKKNMMLQSNQSSEKLSDNLTSENQKSLSHVQNSGEITLSASSALPRQSLNQELSSLSEGEGMAYKRKESLDRNSSKISPTSNINHKSNHTTPGANAVSETVASNYMYGNQNSPVSNACSSSYAAQNRRAQSTEKNTAAKTPKSLSDDSRSNLESEDSSPMKPKQSQILQEMLEQSDSDDVLYSISQKKRESTCDNIDVEGNYIELSTQLKHSDPKTLEFNELSLWQKQKVPALQIGIGMINPVLNVDEANFSKHIKQVLKDIKFYGPSCIQSVIWPSIEKNRCMVAVAPPHSGKTVSYVLPLVSSFTEGRGPRSHNNGPSAVILCSSWLKAQAVYDLFYFFLGDKKMNIIALCTDGGHYRNKVVSLINSCDVLIATPYCLLQYLKNDSIKFAQLDNLILDDSTALMNKHKKELKNILLSYMHAIKREGVASQLLLFAERWNRNFKLILDKMMSNPLILFTSFLESALYAKISIIAHVCKSEEKKSTLIDVVAKEVGKVVICSTNISDAVDVHRFLSYEDVRSFLVNEEMEHYLADEVIRDWKSIKCIANPHCLVITDQVLIKRLSISDADCLIHYDIPPESRLQFGNRFSCIAEHFKVTNHPHCVSHILVAESDYSYATQIIEIIENSGGKPSEALVELSLKQDQVEASLDLLCPYFKAFGFCKERLCKNRHTIDSEKDKPQIVPYEGDIQGFVTHIVDASRCYLRLLKYLDPVSNKTVSLVSAYAELGFLLRDFYCSAPDEMKVDLPLVGESYVLSEENSLFYRVKVLKEVTKDASTSWKLLFLDEGWIKYYEKPVLYKLTDQIDLPEPLAVEVYVCNIITPDSCFEWNPQTSQLVSDLIKGKEIHGRIALCLGRTLWLEPIALVLPLPNSNDYVNLFKLNQKLLDCGHARPNKDHLVTLHKACDGKIPRPRVVKSRIKKEEKIPSPVPTLSYAFLECNAYEDVYVSSVKSPHQFYVQRAKFVECLDNLLDKINDQIESRMLKKAFTLYKGMHCIAPFYEDDRYYRAMITDVFDSEVQLFYVDFGDKGKAVKNSIYCLPAEFLLLPFQAIECELAGIAAAHGGWTDSSVDALTTLTRDENGDMKIVQLKAYSKTSCYEGGNHYVIDLWFNDKNLSEQLLQAGLGIPAEIPEIAEAEPPLKVPQDSSPECSSDEEFDLNEKKLSSDEEDPEDKDTTALFYGYVAEMVMQAANLIPKPGVEITEVSSDDGICVSNTNENDELKAKKAYKDFVKLLPNMNLRNRGESSLEQCSSSLRPLITWWDTPEQLNILINLKDIKMYQLVVTDTGFNFNTIIAGIQYSADEKFYDEIQSSDARKYQTAQGVNIIAKKLTPFKWPRFTKEKQKFLHIKYDLIHIDDSDTEEQTSSTKKQNIRQEYMDEGSSSSTDEEEKYVEPWKDFAQQKNPFSVLE